MASPLESAVSNFSFVLEQNARLITTVGTLSAISFAVVPILEQNYRAYIDAGRGGLPPNVYGWAKSSLLKIFLACETTNTDMYLSDPNKDTWLDPSEVTKRHGERPIFNWHPVPSRQITQRADAAMHEVISVSTLYVYDLELKLAQRKYRISSPSTQGRTRTWSKSHFPLTRSRTTRWSSTQTVQRPTKSPQLLKGKFFTFTRARIGRYIVSFLH